MTAVHRARMSEAGDHTLRWGLGIAVLALSIRLAFVAWAPDRVAGDAYWYNLYARLVRNGIGYVEIDGSPVIQWMPGWPFFLAGVYEIFGTSIRAAMVVNAFLGSATAALLIPLGTRLFRAPVGRAGALLYAVWPGAVYFSAILMTESLFNFLLVASLLFFAIGIDHPQRVARCAAGGLGFGLASLVKAESLALVPVLLVFIWFARPTLREFVPVAAAAGLAGALVISPWVVRNYQQLDRIVVTSAAGGMNVYIGNHDGATGGEMFSAASEYAKRHQGANRAETMLAMNRSGWKDAGAFVSSDPAQELRILGRKLERTYTRDDGAVLMMRGPGAGKNNHFLSAAESAGLRRVANLFWYFGLAAAAGGFASIRTWRPTTGILVVGTFATFAVVHLIFLGGPRFHMSEVPMLALVAGSGLVAGRDRLRGIA